MRTPQDDSALDELLPTEALQERVQALVDWALATATDINVALQLVWSWSPSFRR